MVGRGTFTIVRVRGIPVRVHWTLLVLIPYLALALAYEFPSIAQTAGVRPADVQLPRIAWGILLAIGLFVSVVLHELAHSVVAIWRGGRVKEIVLMVVGGVSVIESMPKRRWEEGLVAAVGPLLSLLLGGVLFAGYAASQTADARFGLFYLAETNLVLGVFNLLPAFPMDGGRIFRALLASWLGAARATEISARVGKGLAALLGLLGIVAGSMLTVLVALFLYTGADTEARAQRLRDALAGLRMADLMMQNPLSLPASVSLADAAALMLAAGRGEAVAVDEDGHALGVVRVADLARVTARGPASVGWLGDRLRARVAFITPDTLVDAALAEHPTADVFVALNPHVAGLLNRATVETAVALLMLERRLAGRTPVMAPPRTRQA